MSSRKFTIIIPTRDRCDTLAATIRNVLSQKYANFSVLVSDNASTDGTAEFVASIKDDRLHYVNTGGRLSMSHNWEFALSHVTDGWVTLIGDDDAILPGALQRVNRIIEATGARAIRANGCTYEWPGFQGREYGTLTVGLGRGYRKVSSGHALRAVLDGELEYFQLPTLYNGGFVDTSLVTSVKAITGKFFASMTPDVYSSIVFSLILDDYVYSDEPLAVNGASHHSGGTAAFGGKKMARKYDPAEKFWSESNIPFHKDLPLIANARPVRSIQAIVYESYLQAAPFHHYKGLSVRPEDQLEVILRNPYPHAAEVFEWAKSFAELHGIDHSSIVLKAAASRPRQAVLQESVRVGISNLVRSFAVFGSRRQPLLNVHEAGIVAGRLLASRPRSMSRALNMAERVCRKAVAVVAG